MYIVYLQNDFIFSAIIGILSVILTYIESKSSKEHYSIKNYLKIFACVSICVYFAIYIKSTSLLNLGPNNTSKSSFGGGGSVNLDNYSNVNIGDPGF